ncbi:glycosyltransferase [uncultured Sunxiuqinia sp.]|uniref:glycosyltransferase n=1 Tax=uncultured Sunxiuqinia sp. TaxID=1573825 RepID=UPI00262055FA|nr:glycosyltransferase [uncultured Sunxiuqinia sp.]
MKILCVIDSLGSGGAQRQLVNLAVGLKQNGHKVSFLVYHRINFFKDILDENNIAVHEIIAPNHFMRLLKMRRYIRHGNFNSVLSFLEAPNFICEIAGFPRRKWKLVVGERSANPAILKSFKLKAYRWFHLFADYVVANSHANIKMVRKVNPLLASRKCKVIYNIVDFKKWQSNEKFTPQKDGKFNIVIAASHRYLKNLNCLVEAVNLLTKEEKNKLKIDWYGDDNHDDSKSVALKKIEKYQLDNVFSFHPPTLDINKKIHQADAVGLFSILEGLPNTVCEAMVAGKPVIATRVSDVPLLILNSNFLSNPFDAQSISKSLSYALNSHPNDLLNEGISNKNIAENIFKTESILQQYLLLLNS